MTPDEAWIVLLFLRRQRDREAWEKAAAIERRALEEQVRACGIEPRLQPAPWMPDR